MPKARRILPAAALAAFAAAALTVRRSRGLMRTWGATRAEAESRLAGDTFVAHPAQRATMAISIGTRPEHVWPWLVQMGKGRGGLYSYDWLDRLFRILDAPSAKAILPRYQSLRVGDVIPVGKAGGFPVLAVEPAKHLVLGGGDDEWTVTWSFVLEPEDENSTRLVTRYRGNYPGTLRNRVVGALITPAAFLMTRRMLLNLRERAEGLAGA